MDRPVDGRGPLRENDRGYTGRSGSGRRSGAGGVEQREQWEDLLAIQAGRENELSQTNHSVRGVCVGVVGELFRLRDRVLGV